VSSRATCESIHSRSWDYRQIKIGDRRQSNRAESISNRWNSTEVYAKSIDRGSSHTRIDRISSRKPNERILDSWCRHERRTRFAPRAHDTTLPLIGSSRVESRESSTQNFAEE